MRPTFLEFFAGGGMARSGLAADWDCVFANDIDKKKAFVYRANWGEREFQLRDIVQLKSNEIPLADLAWASFPCQDLSLAGNGLGLRGGRSGLFWTLWSLLSGLTIRPRVLVLENVGGTLTSRGGEDFQEICRALAALKYVFGGVVIDAAYFVPQSRPRVFIIAVQSGEKIPPQLLGDGPDSLWAPSALSRQYHELAVDLKKAWRWWRLPKPPNRQAVLADIISDQPTDVSWHDANATKRLLAMMSETNRAKVTEAQNSGMRCIGAVYRRTRVENGQKFQRAEVRFDDIAGCLRTPGGGSSRQIILLVNGETIKSRLLSKYEAAALMGYAVFLPDSYNEAYHFLGDGLAVPVVRFLSDNLLLPIATHAHQSLAA